jgi:hypothetical protein
MIENTLSTALGGVLGEVITAVLGILLTGITTYGAFYMKKMTDKMKRKDLINEVKSYVQWALQADSFKAMNPSEKNETVFIKAQQYAMENGISVTPEELKLIVETSVQSLKQLENVGLRLMAVKYKGENK